MVSVEGFIKDFICVHYKANCSGSHCEDDMQPRWCEEAIKQLTALIKQEALKMLPELHSIKQYVPDGLKPTIEPFDRGFNTCLSQVKQNISNYTIERSGE